MRYKIQVTENFRKNLKKLDKQYIRLINNWIIKNLLDIENPTVKGKALTGNLKGIWRYRIGDYRLIVEIEDDQLKIIAFEFAHRSSVYKFMK